MGSHSLNIFIAICPILTDVTKNTGLDKYGGWRKERMDDFPPPHQNTVESSIQFCNHYDRERGRPQVSLSESPG